MMNVGIFLQSLKPRGASEARFQGTIFDALKRARPDGLRFTVFTLDDVAGFTDTDQISYVKLDWIGPPGAWKLRLGRVGTLITNLLGPAKRGVHDALKRWTHPTQPYHAQISARNIRIMWNLSQHVLETKIPFIQVVWDINNHIYPMYPEYSYARFGFDDGSLPHTLPRASYVLTGTEEGKNQIVNTFGVYPGKVRVTPFPAPRLDAPATSAALPASEPYLYYPARFWPHKNHVVLLEALNILKAQGARVRCVFTGAEEGNFDYVSRYAQNLGVEDQIDYLGMVPEARMVALYQGALALAFVSAVGPDNLPPLEAMALGCPVVTAEVVGSREQYGDAALFFPPHDEHQLAAQIVYLLNNPAERQALIARGHKRAAAWTADDYVASVISLLKEFGAIARAWERCDSQFT